MSRTKYAFKAIIYNIVLQLTIAICGFILPPLLIENYGSEVNGLITTIRQLISYFSIVTLGLATAGAVSLYKPLEEKNISKINGILAELKKFYNKTGIFFSALIGMTAFLLPLLKSSSDISGIEIGLLVIICGSGSVIEYVITSKYKVLLTADQKNYILAKIQTEGTLLNTICSVILIKLNASIILIQLTATVVYVLRMLLTVRYVKKEYKYIDLSVKPLKNEVKDRWSAFSYQASSMVISYTPLIIVATMLSFSSASVFSIYYQIFSAITMMVGIFSTGLAAAFGNVLVKGEKELLEKRFNMYEFLYRNILFIMFTCASLLIIPFVSIYIKSVDSEMYIVPLLGLFSSINGLFKSMRIPYTTIMEAGGDFKANNFLNILEALFNVILTIIFVKFFGLNGVMVGAIITSFIRTILYIRFIGKKYFEGKWIKYLLYNIIDIIIFFIIYFLISIPYPLKTSKWILYAVILTIVTSLIYIIINSILNIESVKEICIFIKNRFKIKKEN